MPVQFQHKCQTLRRIDATIRQRIFSIDVCGRLIVAAWMGGGGRSLPIPEPGLVAQSLPKCRSKSRRTTEHQLPNLCLHVLVVVHLGARLNFWERLWHVPLG